MGYKYLGGYATNQELWIKTTKAKPTKKAKSKKKR